MAKAGQQRFRGLAVSGKFLRVKHGDGVAGLYFSAFVHRQPLNPSADLRAHNNLVGVNGADQDQIRRAVRGKKVIHGGNDQQQAKKAEKFVALAHSGPTFLRRFRSEDGGANEIEHRGTASGDPFRRTGIARHA